MLLPFQRIAVTLGRSAGATTAREVHNLRGADWAGGAPMLTGAALFSGFYLNELLMKLLARHDPHAALFDAYAATLPRLGAATTTRCRRRCARSSWCCCARSACCPTSSIETRRSGRSTPDARYACSPTPASSRAGGERRDVERRDAGRACRPRSTHGSLARCSRPAPARSPS